MTRAIVTTAINLALGVLFVLAILAACGGLALATEWLISVIPALS